MDIKSGAMPRTDFTYEELENFLLSFYRSLKPYQDKTPKNHIYFGLAVLALNELADRHNVRQPAIADTEPRRTSEDWGKPQVWSQENLRHSLRAFYSDFGIGLTKGNGSTGHQRLGNSSRSHGDGGLIWTLIRSANSSPSSMSPWLIRRSVGMLTP